MIIFYCSEGEDFADNEVMVTPFIDFRVNTIQDLIDLLENLTRIEK